uniref:Uncharacterized protein n=1 Tax=Cacopsylla melanoneura TaxID=428564 RepID=A0A8D8RM76_9HEMI
MSRYNPLQYFKEVFFSAFLCELLPNHRDVAVGDCRNRLPLFMTFPAGLMVVVLPSANCTASSASLLSAIGWASDGVFFSLSPNTPNREPLCFSNSLTTGRGSPLKFTVCFCPSPTCSKCPTPRGGFKLSFRADNFLSNRFLKLLLLLPRAFLFP